MDDPAPPLGPSPLADTLEYAAAQWAPPLGPSHLRQQHVAEFGDDGHLVLGERVGIGRSSELS